MVRTQGRMGLQDLTVHSQGSGFINIQTIKVCKAEVLAPLSKLHAH